MEENKDFMNSEFEVEQNDNTTSDTIQTELDNEFNDSNVEINEVEITASPIKKKPLIQAPIIISLVLVLVVAASFFVMKGFFNTSVVGTWIVSPESTPDEATKATESVDPNINYYTFEKYDAAENSGKAIISLGTVRMVGSYTVTEGKDGKDNTININIPNALQDSFTYTVSGNIFSGRKLILTSSYYNKSLNFESAKIVTPELKPDPDFKANDKLTGVWTYNDGYNKFSYEFNSDGTALFNQYDLLFADGTYTYTDETIVITYYISAIDTGEMEINYFAEDDKLIINGYEYYKETPASADQS